MIIYLRDKNGVNQSLRNAFAWECHLDNSHDTKLSTSCDPSFEGGQLLIPQLHYAGIISAITPKDGYTEVVAKPVISLFDRLIRYEASSNMGAFLSNAIAKNFGQSQTDSFFRNSWLSTSITDAGSYEMPDTDEFGFFNLKDYIAQQERAGRIILQAVPTADGITLSNHTAERELVWFGNASHELKSESYSGGIISKITNISENGSATDYYLFTDGTHSTNPSSGTRVQGTWVITQKLDADGITNKFAEAKYDHKIVFVSTKQLMPGQQVGFRMKDGRVIESIISCVRRSYDSDRTYYEAGNLKTTLTEILGGLKNG